MIIKDVRCSYVFIQKPRAEKDPNRKAKYGLQIIIPKDHPQLGEVKKAITKAAREKFGDIKLTTIKIPLRDGDTDRDSDEYENTYFVNANTERKPQIVNKHNAPASEADLDEYCYSGATYHVSLNFYAFNFEGKKGVAAGLNNVMLRKATGRLDGTVSAEKEFEEFKEPSTGTDFDDFDDDIPF